MIWLPIDECYLTLSSLYRDRARPSAVVDVAELVRLGDHLVALASRCLATRTVRDGHRAATCHKRAVDCYRRAGMTPDLIRVSTCDDFEAFARREGPQRHPHSDAIG